MAKRCHSCRHYSQALQLRGGQCSLFLSQSVSELCVCVQSGAILAALTTSIPEAPDSGRTWDYRFCWLRDSYVNNHHHQVTIAFGFTINPSPSHNSIRFGRSIVLVPHERWSIIFDSVGRFMLIVHRHHHHLDAHVPVVVNVVASAGEGDLQPLCKTIITEKYISWG